MRPSAPLLPLSTGTYPTGVEIPDSQMNALNDTSLLQRHDWHPEWNYTLGPPPDPD